MESIASIQKSNGHATSEKEMEAMVCNKRFEKPGGLYWLCV